MTSAQEGSSPRSANSCGSLCEIVQHRPEAGGVDVFPAAVEHHEQPALLDRLVQLQPHVLHANNRIRRISPCANRPAAAPCSSGISERPSRIWSGGLPPKYSMKVGARSIASTSASLTVPRVASASRRGIDHDQRNFGGLIVKQILLAHPVIAEIIAMIRREHDHGVFEQAARFEEAHQHAHLVVDLLDQAHIGRDDFFPRLVARHVAGVAHVHIGGEHRMRFLAFLFRADRRLHVGRRRTCWRRVLARYRASAA